MVVSRSCQRRCFLPFGKSALTIVVAAGSSPSAIPQWKRPLPARTICTDRRRQPRIRRAFLVCGRLDVKESGHLCRLFGCIEDVRDDVVRLNVLGLPFEIQNQPVPQHIRRYVSQVITRYMIALVKDSMNLGCQD